MSDTHSNDLAKAKAEATFKRRQEQARDGAIAMSEYLAAQAATSAKIARLRALRLSNEAAAAAKPDKAVKTKPKPAGKKKPAGRITAA